MRSRKRRADIALRSICPNCRRVGSIGITAQLEQDDLLICGQKSVRARVSDIAGLARDEWPRLSRRGGFSLGSRPFSLCEAALFASQVEGAGLRNHGSRAGANRSLYRSENPFFYSLANGLDYLNFFLKWDGCLDWLVIPSNSP